MSEGWSKAESDRRTKGFTLTCPAVVTLETLATARCERQVWLDQLMDDFDQWVEVEDKWEVGHCLSELEHSRKGYRKARAFVEKVERALVAQEKRP